MAYKFADNCCKFIFEKNPGQVPIKQIFAFSSGREN